MKAKLLRDIRSTQKGRQLYGKINDSVIIISDGGLVLIVEGPAWTEEKGIVIKTEKKHRYPVAVLDIKFE